MSGAVMLPGTTAVLFRRGCVHHGSMRMRDVRRVLLAVAGLSLLLAPVLGLLPVHARPVISSPPPGRETVNCGTVFADTEWSGDDGCEGPLLSRGGLVVLMALIAVSVGAIGLTLMETARIRGSRCEVTIRG